MRHLSLRLLDTYRRRGELLLQACRSGHLSQVCQQHSISNDEAHVCIALHQNWSLFLQAEQWNNALDRRCPKTPMMALVLIDHWVAAGSPRTSAIQRYMDKAMTLLFSVIAALAQAADLSEVGLVVDVLC